MRKNRVINQGFTRSRKFRVDIMYIIYDNMITSRNMNFLIMATTEPLSLFVGGAICRVESDLKCLTCWHQHKVQGEGYRSWHIIYILYYIYHVYITMKATCWPQHYWKPTHTSHGGMRYIHRLQRSGQLWAGPRPPRPPTRHTSLAGKMVWGQQLTKWAS